jgi:hypothetical protein
MAKLFAQSLLTGSLTTARSTVLLITLIVVPLLAALGTSPGRWSPSDDSAANQDQQPADPKDPLAAATSRSQTNHTNTLRAADLNLPRNVATADKKSVIRHWHHDAPPSPVDPKPTPQDSAIAPKQPSQFQQIEQQLRDWGATYYRLEQWSSEGPLYRFQCRISIRGLKQYNHHLEAVAPDPVGAMLSVVEQARKLREPLARRPAH